MQLFRKYTIAIYNSTERKVKTKDSTYTQFTEFLINKSVRKIHET